MFADFKRTSLASFDAVIAGMLNLSVACVSVERRSCHGGMMTAAGWIVAVDKLIETGQIQISNCDANFAVGTIRFSSQLIAMPPSPS